MSSSSPTPARQRLAWTGMTHRGNVRPNNEDSFLAITFDAYAFHYLGKYGEGTMEEGDYVFAVSDGMGGAQAGEFASRIAVDQITKLLPKSFRNQAIGLEAGFSDLFQQIFSEIHRAMTYLGSNYEECSGMGSTLSLCWFTPGWLYYGHIGDSRIYYLPAEGGLKQLTQDDSHVGWLQRTGKISEREARSHPRKNALQKGLGAGHQFIEPQVGAVGYEKGDMFMLCSDGLVDGLWDRQILQLLREPEEREKSQLPAARLVEASLERSGRDNTTAVVVEIV